MWLTLQEGSDVSPVDTRPLTSFYQPLTLRPCSTPRSKDDIYLVLYDGIYDQCVHSAVSEPCVCTFRDSSEMLHENNGGFQGFQNNVKGFHPNGKGLHLKNPNNSRGFRDFHLVLDDYNVGFQEQDNDICGADAKLYGSNIDVRDSNYRYSNNNDEFYGSNADKQSLFPDPNENYRDSDVICGDGLTEKCADNVQGSSDTGSPLYYNFTLEQDDESFNPAKSVND